MKASPNNNFPNLIIAGAPKSGTSSVFFWLGAHPDVCGSKVKETYFLGDNVNNFNRELNVHQHGFESYNQFFRHCSAERYRMEATPVYIYHQTPLKHLQLLPQPPKVIFVLRRPGNRLYSHWRFNRYRMKNIKLSFEEYLDFSNAPKNWANYLEQTNYVDYIMPWVKQLGKENVLVYQFEKLLNDKEAFMMGICRDLGIDGQFYNTFDFFHRNETVKVTSSKLHRFALKMEPFFPTKIQEKIIPLYLKLNSGKIPEITDADKVLIENANARYRQKNQELASEFSSINLELW